MAENTRKPIVCTAEGRDDLREMWEITKIIRNGEEHLRMKPYFIRILQDHERSALPIDKVGRIKSQVAQFRK